uniref:Legume lectin domain-containing protein n=1 Tax=Oryza brachyantha TaxID=4533 RepID=J3LVG4_ORYBR
MTLPPDAARSCFIAAAPAPVSFNYNFTGDNPSSYLHELTFQDDATTEPQTIGPVNLTCSLIICKRSGRMTYARPVQLYHQANGGRTEVASFFTSFTFPIGPIKGNCRGDGMAFFLAGFPSKVPYQSAGGNLGLISNGETNAPASDQFIAVEFDIGNEYGVDEERQDHIAIDINSVKNSVNKTILPNNLTLDGKMTADISFDGSTRMLVASLRFLDHPSLSAPLIQVAVGFSASTGFCQELSQIL